MKHVIAFDLGEKKHIYIEIISKKKQEFEVYEATYELLKKPDRIVEDQGVCTINGHMLDVIISPQKAGGYILRITYHIADEILIEQIEVQVQR